MTQYYVEIGGVSLTKVQRCTTQRVMTNRAGKWDVQLIDPTNAFYDAISSGDEMQVKKTSGDAVQYGGYVEKKKRDGGKKYVLKLSGGDYLLKANQVFVDVLIYRRREYGVMFRDIANKYICTTLLIDAMDATTGWAAASDFSSLVANTAVDGNSNPVARLGAACLEVDGTYSGGSGTLTKTMGSGITVNADDYYGVYFYTAATSDLGTNIKLHFGQDNSNYYTVTLATSSLSDGWNYVEFDTSTKTTGGGSPALTSVDYYQIEVDLDSGASGEAIYFDDLRRIENAFLPSQIAITTDYADYVEFKNSSVFNMWKKIADLKENIYDFHIDKSKVVWFGTFGVTDSGVDLTRGTNIVDLDLWDDDQGLVNFVEVYGKRQLFEFEQSFNGDASETEFTLTYEPQDTYIEVDSAVQLGYKEDLTNTSFDYTVDNKARKVTFESGSVPGSGTNNVVVRYTYSIPTRVEWDDEDSIATYNLRGNKVENDHLLTRQDCLDFAKEYIAKHKDPIVNGIAKTTLQPTVDVGETVDITHAKFFTGTQVFTTAAIKHFFIGTKLRSEITLSNVRQDIEQYLSQLLIRMNAVEDLDKGSSDLKTKAKSFVDSLSFSDDPSSDLTIKSRAVNTTDTWYFGKPHLFSEPIKFGGGSGKFGANLVANPSS